MTLVVLTGASGSGKTTIAREIAARCGQAAAVFHFDSIGVPPVEQMIRDYGSGEAWQRAKTVEWFARLAADVKAGLPVLFEGQTRFSFLADGAAAAGGVVYLPILIDCDDVTRSSRLRNERQQAELDTDEMKNWARYLRREARSGGYPILNTSVVSLPDSVKYVLQRLRP